MHVNITIFHILALITVTTKQNLLYFQEQSPSNATSLAMMQEPQEVLEETVTIEEDPGTPTSHVSVVTSDDGTTRRTETKVGFLPTFSI